ncbi:MAG: DUF3172 domain-containing protein [Xenococcaceae cyanobacterium]
MKNRSRSSYDQKDSPRSSPPRQSSFFNFNVATIALLAAIFILGVGVGIVYSSGQNFNTANVASREIIDRSAPNPELCIQFGASAIVSDMRVFITLNPFNVFVTQPSMRPGCVLRRNNWSILEQQNLVNSEQVRDCKHRMNTFGFTGNLESSPEISCIYQNEAAGNLFLNESGTSRPEETDRF